jgi:tetratricopeptide (TPR) repeat protein
LVVFLCGLLLGLAFHFSHNAIQIWFPQDDSLLAKNSLLVSQQLDQLFRKIDEGVAEDPARLEAYLGLLQTFYVYDRRFVEQNEGSRTATTETASAEQRLGLCARVFGDLELSKTHYRKALDTLNQANHSDPESVLVLQNWLDVATIIATLEQASGQMESGRQAFHVAMQRLRQSQFEDSLEADEWLAPQYRVMASVAIELGLYQDARDLANRYVASLRDLVAAYPSDDQWRKQSLEAVALIEQVNQHLPPDKT